MDDMVTWLSLVCIVQCTVRVPRSRLICYDVNLNVFTTQYYTAIHLYSENMIMVLYHGDMTMYGVK